MKLTRNHLLLIVVGLLLIVTAQTHPRRRKHSAEKKKVFDNSTNFDVLIFTQHWPQTVCYTWKESQASHTCNIPSDDEWTIHGIWPTQFHKVGPLFCNNSMKFDAAALAPIEKEMEKKWIDVENGTKHYSFWKHEWQKHGTCSAVLEPLNTEEKYFKKGLQLLDTYDMKNVLAQKNILPGQSYSVGAILDAVTKVLGKRGQVICVANRKEKISYLFEIRICFDKNLKLVDCDGIVGFPTNCSPKRDVIYPGDVPDVHHIIRI